MTTAPLILPVGAKHRLHCKEVKPLDQKSDNEHPTRLWYAVIVHGGGWSKLVSTSRIRIPVHFLILGLMFRACSGLASAQVPLPATLSIEAPGADVPATDAAFSGAWGNS